MRVLVFGSSGMIGAAIVAELLSRGHEVTGVTRSGEPGAVAVPTVAGDVTDAAQVEALARGNDAAISAVRPKPGEGPDRVISAARALVTALPAAGVRRLLVVGGAGGLLTDSGERYVDTGVVPEAYKPFSQAHVEAYDVYTGATDVDWTFVSCAGTIEPGERTGVFRLGTDHLMRDADGVSRISTQDYAVALVDELEQPARIGGRLTMAY